MKACMLVETEIGAESDVAARLRKTPGVTDAWTVFGASDAVALFEVDDAEALDHGVSEAGRIQGVVGTETLPEIEVT